MTTAIQTNGLTKDYGSAHGIFDLDLTVNEGEVFGYLGPNGAGKTTTIKLLMGLIHATKGHATILGLDVDRDAVPLKHKIGYVPGELPQFGGNVYKVNSPVHPNLEFSIAHFSQLYFSETGQQLTANSKIGLGSFAGSVTKIPVEPGSFRYGANIFAVDEPSEPST